MSEAPDIPEPDTEILVNCGPGDWRPATVVGHYRHPDTGVLWLKIKGMVTRSPFPDTTYVTVASVGRTWKWEGGDELGPEGT